MPIWFVGRQGTRISDQEFRPNDNVVAGAAGAIQYADNWLWRDETEQGWHPSFQLSEQPQIHSTGTTDRIVIPLLDPATLLPNDCVLLGRRWREHVTAFFGRSPKLNAHIQPAQRGQGLELCCDETTVTTKHESELPELTALRDSILTGPLQQDALQAVTSARAVAHILKIQVASLDAAVQDVDGDVTDLEREVLSQQRTAGSTREKLLRRLITVARIAKLYGAYERVCRVLVDPRYGAYRTRGAGTKQAADVQEGLATLLDHVLRGSAKCKELREVLSAIEGRLLLEETARTNDLLMVVSLFLLPASLVAGLFGMNFEEKFPVQWGFRNGVVFVIVSAIMWLLLIQIVRWIHDRWIDTSPR